MPTVISSDPLESIISLVISFVRSAIEKISESANDSTWFTFKFPLDTLFIISDNLSLETISVIPVWSSLPISFNIFFLTSKSSLSRSFVGINFIWSAKKDISSLTVLMKFLEIFSESSTAISLFWSTLALLKLNRATLILDWL